MPVQKWGHRRATQKKRYCREERSVPPQSQKFLRIMPRPLPLFIAKRAFFSIEGHFEPLLSSLGRVAHFSSDDEYTHILLP
jgi:hypothetical protein